MARSRFVRESNAQLKLALVAMALLVASSPSASALTFQFNYVDSPTGTFASRGWLNPQSLFQRNIRAAADRWAGQINSPATLVVRVDTTSYAARAGGAFSFGRFLHNNAAGKQVWETGPLTRILTGDNPGEDFYHYDIVLGFDASFVENNYWFDPNPTLRSAPVPANRGDFVSVVMHEMGHAFGMAGNRDFSTGQFLGAVVSQFDDQTEYIGDGNPFDLQGAPNPMRFTGALAAGVYGDDVPLTHKPIGHPNYGQNFYHLSACDSEAPDGLEGSLMNGCVLPNGSRLTITPVETAVYADLGYPLRAHGTADFNGDGAVDALDLKVWRTAYAQDDLADANQDGESDGADLAAWQRQLGEAPALGVAVPEPSVFMLLCLAATRLRRLRCFSPDVGSKLPRRGIV